MPATPQTESLALMVISLVQGMSVLARDGLNRSELLAMAEVSMQAWPQPSINDAVV